jgi:chromate transporter
MPAPPEPAADSRIPQPKPSLHQLFTGFVAVALSGFGGALPWARRMIVERRKWMSADEFNEAFSLAQFLPGPNVVNFSVVFGSRIAGWAGAVVALTGLMAPPIVIVTLLGVLYSFYGDIPALSRVLAGISAAAVGLLVATVGKMSRPLFKRGAYVAPVVALAAFVAIGPLHWPLPYVLLVLAPLSVAFAWMRL